MGFFMTPEHFKNLPERTIPMFKMFEVRGNTTNCSTQYPLHYLLCVLQNNPYDVCGAVGLDDVEALIYGKQACDTLTSCRLPHKILCCAVGPTCT